MVRSGEYRHQIDIQVRSSSTDGHGAPAFSWATFALVRAALVRAPGQEILASAQRSVRVPVVFKIRYLAGVKASMRVVHDSRLHNVLSVVDAGGLKEELMIVTEEISETTP